MKRVQKKLEAISWYIDFFNYIDKDCYPDIPYKKHFERRWVLRVPYSKDDYSIHVGAPLTLAKLRAEERFQNLQYHRQNGYLLRLDSLLEHQFDPTDYYIHLKEKPDFDDTHIREIPAGEYICFRGKVLADEWDPTFIKKFFTKKESQLLVVSDEYEYNLKEFVRCVHEVQILVSDHL